LRGANRFGGNAACRAFKRRLAAASALKIETVSAGFSCVWVVPSRALRLLRTARAPGAYADKRVTLVIGNGGYLSAAVSHALA